MMSICTGLRIVAVMVVFMIAPLQAQYVEIFRLDAIAKELPEQEAVSKLATHLSIPAATLQQQKTELKVSIGELYMAHQLAKVMRADVKKVVSDLRSVKPWGTLAKENNLDLDAVRKDSRQLEETLKKSQRAAR